MAYHKRYSNHNNHSRNNKAVSPLVSCADRWADLPAECGGGDDPAQCLGSTASVLPVHDSIQGQSEVHQELHGDAQEVGGGGAEEGELFGLLLGVFVGLFWMGREELLGDAEDVRGT